MKYNHVDPDRIGQIPNSAGGFSYEVDKWTQLQRFLILGSDTGSYYVGAQALTLQNAKAVLECLKEDPKRTVDEIVSISQAGRAAKNSNAIFALALASAPQYNPKGASYALEALPSVCRTGTHLFEFLEYLIGGTKPMRGTGRNLRTSVSNWYLEKSLESLQYQLIKYQQRNGWSHKNVLQISHPTPNSKEISEIFHWVTDPDSPEVNVEGYDLLFAFERVQGALQSKEVVEMISAYSLPWEAIPTQWLRNPDVRMALLQKMPVTAMVRQLGLYSSLKLTEMRSEGEQKILEVLGNSDALHKSRIHPFQILLALQIYAQGHGERGSNTWDVNPRIVEALEHSFYSTFSNAASSNTRILLGVDISGSMRHQIIESLSNMPASYAASALALMMVNVEPYCDTVAFDVVAEERILTKRSSIRDTMEQFVPRGGTDCGSVIDYAAKHEKIYDAILIFTDSQTWANKSNPYARFKAYQQTFNPAAKLVTVAMVSNVFSLSPAASDASVFDCVGFDANVPQLISDFLR